MNGEMVLKIRDFSGGLNIKYSNELLQPNEARFIRNALLEKVGESRKRKGYRIYNTNDLINEQVTGLYHFIKLGTIYFIAFTQTKMYQEIGDTFIEKPLPILLSLEKIDKFQFTTLHNLCFMVNGKTKNLKYNGENVRLMCIEKPTTTGILTAGAAGDIHLAGKYRYKITFYNNIDGTESPASDGVEITLTTNVASITISEIPTNPIPPDPQVTSRRIYRTLKDGKIFFLVTQIDDITTTSYTDTVKDETLMLKDTLKTEYCLSPSDIEGTKYITEHKGRIFFVKDNSSDLYFSEYNEPEIIPAEYFITVAKDDGDVITGIKSLGDMLIIFKNNSIYALLGDDIDNFVLRQLNKSIGCIAPYSIVEYENIIFFLSQDNIYGFDGSNLINISDKIEPAIKEMLDKKDCYGFIFDKKYYLYLPYHKLVYVYDLTIKNWTVFDNMFINCHSHDKLNNKLYLGFVDKNYIYLLDDIYYDELDRGNKMPIKWQWQTKAFDFDNENIYKRFTEFELFLDGQLEDITISAVVDYDDVVMYATETTPEGANPRHYWAGDIYENQWARLSDDPIPPDYDENKTLLWADYYLIPTKIKHYKFGQEAVGKHISFKLINEPTTYEITTDFVLHEIIVKAFMKMSNYKKLYKRGN